MSFSYRLTTASMNPAGMSPFSSSSFSSACARASTGESGADDGDRRRARSWLVQIALPQVDVDGLRASRCVAPQIARREADVVRELLAAARRRARRRRAAESARRPARRRRAGRARTADSACDRADADCARARRRRRRSAASARSAQAAGRSPRTGRDNGKAPPARASSVARSNRPRSIRDVAMPVSQCS